jgi:hypothetical protein
MEMKHPGLTYSNARVRNSLFEIEFMLSKCISCENSKGSCNGVLMLSIILNTYRSPSWYCRWFTQVLTPMELA